MATVNLSLSDSMASWIDDQTQAGRYHDAEEYVADLIRRDQERAGKIEAMQRLVDEAVASGPSVRSMEDILAEARAGTARGEGDGV